MVRVFRDFVVALLGAWVIFITCVRRLVRGPKHPTWSFRLEIWIEILRAVIKLGHEHMSIELRRTPRQQRSGLDMNSRQVLSERNADAL